MLSRAEADRMSDMEKLVSRAFGASVPHTKISRVLWTILGDMEERLQRHGVGEPRPQPSTGNPDAQAEFEVELYEFLSTIITRNN